MAAQDNNRSRLGRGLASLIGDASGTSGGVPITSSTPVIPGKKEPVSAVEAAVAVVQTEEGHKTVPIDTVSASPLNPRKNFSHVELAELASSIKERGVVQPLIVRPSPSGKGYELVAGERRWRASQQAGVHEVPIIIRELNDQQVLELAIIENVQRTDLNAIEEAFGYNELVKQHGYSQEQLAKIIGKSRSHLTNTLRLLKLPETIQMLVRDGSISAGHARAIIGNADAEKFAKMIVEEGLSVRQIEDLVKEATKEPEEENSEEKDAIIADADVGSVEQEISDLLGLAVNIKKGRGQCGEIRVKYKTIDQFDDLYLRLMGKYIT